MQSFHVSLKIKGSSFAASCVLRGSSVNVYFFLSLYYYIFRYWCLLLVLCQSRFNCLIHCVILRREKGDKFNILY